MISEKELSEIVGNYWTELHEYSTGGVLDDDLLEFANEIASHAKKQILNNIAGFSLSSVSFGVKKQGNTSHYGITKSNSDFYFATDMRKHEAEAIAALLNMAKQL